MESDQPAIEVPNGFRAAAVRSGVKPSGGLDLALLVADVPCSAAGTFTTNRFCAAPVKWDRARVPSDRIRAVVVNAGNANAATGAQGDANARRTAETAAWKLGCLPDQVLVASTGVIGRQLPMDRIEDGVRSAAGALDASPGTFEAVSRAIMTTDTRPKIVARRIEVDGRSVRLLGLAKGAAMIGPRMATMLAFIMTDAAIAPTALQELVSGAVDDSFNCISVDGSMSTNDSVLMLASGGSGLDVGTGPAAAPFAELVRQACADLARMIPGDGEGATHLITIDVEGCRDAAEARAIARNVANDALVKTAIHGADPNWGRIVSAAGYAGCDFEEHEVSLWLNGVGLFHAGAPLEIDAEAVSNSLRSNRDTHIRLVFSRGNGSCRFWTSDLTAEYVRLNADYTT